VARLGIHRDFVRDLLTLPRQIQERVADVFDKFEGSTFAGIHLEKLAQVRDPRLMSIRITQDWRGIVLAPDQGDIYSLLKVMKHDDAYDWAKRRTVTVNMLNGRIEIRDVVTIEETTASYEKDSKAQALLFDEFSDSDLRELGIDDQMLRLARTLTDVEGLESLQPYLPQTQYDVLYALAAGMSREEIWKEIVCRSREEKGAYDTEDLSAAIERSPHQVALVSGPDELMELFRKPFATWRVYLHPTQRAAAYGSYTGPARVTGGPGTGKTVVALHRARYLAKKGGRVLLTTYTSTLVEALKEQLALLEPDASVRNRIDVLTVDTLSMQLVTESLAGSRPVLLSAADERMIWKRIINARKLPWTETFLSEEWRQVVLAQNLDSAARYINARRVGRGRRLGPLQRAEVWRAMEEFTAELTERRLWTFETICASAADLLAAGTRKPYDHVVVDEAQDLHPVRWRVLRQAVAEGPDDLFITGDAHQRIYDNRVTLSSVGISTSGRSSRLTVNYRTTAQILAHGMEMISGEVIQDLDGGLTTLAGCRSEVRGREPRFVEAGTWTGELKNLTDQVRDWLDAGVGPSEIGIVTRTGAPAAEAARSLTKAGIPAVVLTGKRPPQDHVQVATMHRMKGLEFRCVAVIGLNEHRFPEPNAIRPVEEDRASHLQDLLRERCLLFVACTRAREDLYLSWHGVRTSFLK